MNDPSVLMEVVFFDDICEEIYDAMEGHPHRCHYEGVEAVPDENGRYCHCPVKHKATLGEIVNLLHQFHDFPADFIMPKDTVKIFAQIPLSLCEHAKTMITTCSVKRDGAGNFLARGLRWAVGVVALP